MSIPSSRAGRTRVAAVAGGALLALVVPAPAETNDLLDLLVPVFSALAKQDGNQPPGGGGDPPGEDGDPTAPCARVQSADIFVDTTWRNTDAYCDLLIVPRNANDPLAPGRAPVAVENATLTIEAGTRVRFAERASIRIGPGGTLSAVGTANARIRFEAAVAQRGYGRGVIFGNNSRASRIEYADFINLGREESLGTHDAAIVGDRGATGLTLRHSTVSGSSANGAELDRLPIIEFASNVFFDNAGFGLLVGAHQAQLLDASSDFVGTRAGAANVRPYVGVEGVGSVVQVVANATWKSLNAPYFINIALHLRGGGVTVAPGARFVMSEGSRISVDGRSYFRAMGTQARPIVFTGEQATAGYWSNLSYFESGSTLNRLEHVQIRNAGGGRADAAVEIFSGAYLGIANSTITQSASWAVCVDFRSTYVSGGGNDYTGNASGGLVEDC